MKFSIRDLLWLMALAACLCGWWVERQRRITSEVNAGSFRETILLLKEQLETDGEAYQVIVDGQRIERASEERYPAE